MTTNSYLSLRDPRSRREFFRLAGVTTLAGSAALLTACGDDDGGGTATSEEGGKGDVTILNAALDLEHTAIALYTAGVPVLRGAARTLGRAFLAQEKEHAAALVHTIEELGGTPSRARPAAEYRRIFPRLRSQDDVLRFAVDLENTAISAYLGSVAKLSAPALRQTATAINANEAEHVSALLGALGKPEVTNAFVTGKRAA